MLCFKTHPPYFKNAAVEGICGNANGSFALKLANGRFQLFTADGTFLKSIEALDVRILNDNSCFVQELPKAGSSRTVSFLQNRAVWNLYAPDGRMMLRELDSCETYANGWYQTEKDNCRYLYNEQHELVVKGFKQCAVFKNGYALRTNERYYECADWQVYAPDKTYWGHYSNVGAILGDGLFLVYRYSNPKTTPLQRTGDLFEPESGEKFISGICGFKTFPNGRFVLMFESTGFGETSRLYAPTGQRLSTAISDAYFLPDGRFAQLHQKRISAIYRPNGLLHSDEVWTIEIAGNYYLWNYGNIETLYNDKGEDLGDGYGLVTYENNFALFENEQAYHLFNQNGCVLSLDFPE